MNTLLFDEAAKAVPEMFFSAKPEMGVILGSGWGEALPLDRELGRVAYRDIPGLGASTVLGHAGELVLFECAGRKVVAACGRRHYYEGVGWEAVVLPTELMRRMGIKDLLVTNAAGGINPTFQPGDFMVIRDHINLTGLTPLRGPVVPGWGERFPDQTEVYSHALSAELKRAAVRAGITLTEGIYIYSTGPEFETPAEIRAYASLGADAVGMSTIHEVAVAHAAGIRVAGLSCITNLAAGICGRHLVHSEVLEQSKKSIPVMTRLLRAFLSREA